MKYLNVEMEFIPEKAVARANGCEFLSSRWYPGGMTREGGAGVEVEDEGEVEGVEKGWMMMLIWQVLLGKMIFRMIS